MGDMKILLESWREYSTVIETSKNFGSIYLRENKQVVKKDFGTLLERFDSGNLSKEDLYKRWHSSMLYEHKLLMEEMGIDWEKEAGMLDDPDYKPPHERPGMVSQALEKSKDWFLEKSIQIYQMAKRGIESAIDAAGGLIERAKGLASEHPTATKVIVVVGLGLAMFALMSALDSSEATAKIKAPGLPGGLKAGPQGQISDASYEALRGLVHQTRLPELGSETIQMRAEAMNIIDTAQASGKVVDFSTLTTEYGKFANEQLRTLDGLFKIAREGDPEAFQWIKELVEVGKKAVYQVGGVKTR